MGSVENGSKPKYWAFISYSRQDELLARWLHERLETYRVPAALYNQLAGTAKAIPRKAAPVFRDRDELAASGDLSVSLREALRDSRSLIVICSPASSTSRWVNEEVLYFQSLYGNERIFCVLVDGEPDGSRGAPKSVGEYLPAALRKESADPPHDASIPLAADLRRDGDGRELGFLKILAGVISVDLDRLVQRDRRRTTQRRAFAGVAAAVLAACGVAAYMWAENADRSVQLTGLRQQLREAVERERYYTASERLVELVAKGDDSPANRLLLGWTLARAKSHFDSFEVPLRGAEASTISGAFSPDGETVALVGKDGVATLYSAATGNPGAKLAFASGAIASNGHIGRVEFIPDGKSVLTDTQFVPARLWDSRSGERIEDLDPPAGLGVVIGEKRLTASSPRGDRIAVATAVQGAVAIWDLPSLKAHVVRQPGSVGVRRLAFSSDGRLLAVAASDGSIGLVDSASGKPEGELKPSKRSLVDVLFLPGKREMVVLWQDGVELWNPSGSSVPLPVGDGDDLYVQELAVSPAGDVVAGAATDGTVKLWNVEKRQLALVLRMRLSPDEEKEPDLGPPIDVGSYADGERVAEGIAHVGFIGGGSIVVAMHTRGKVCAWDVSVSEALFCLDAPRGRRLGFASAPARNRMLLWGEDAISGAPRALALPFETRRPAELRRALADLPREPSGPL